MRKIPTAYDSAVAAYIADATVSLTPQTYALVEEATKVCVRFYTESAHRVIPFEPLLLRSESVASSHIEN